MFYRGIHTPFLALLLVLLSGGVTTRFLPAQSSGERLADLETRVQQLTALLAALREEKEAQDQEIQALRARLEEAEATEALSNEQVREFEVLAAAAREEELGRLIEAKTQEHGWAEPSHDTGGVSLGGYFDLEFRADKAGKEEATFDQHRLVLQMAAAVSPAIGFRTEIEVEGGGIGASFLTDSEIVVEYAEFRLEIAEEFNIRAGALLVPFNRFNLLHDAPLQDLTDRPLVARRIIPTTWAEAGIGADGAFHTDAVSFDYDLVLVNGLTEAISASDGTRGARGSFREDNNDNKTVIGRLGLALEVPWLDGAGAGLSFAYGKYDDRNQQGITMFGLDFMLKRGPFELVGEYAHISLGRSAREVAAGVPGGMEGWYLEARFHFFPEAWRGSGALLTDQSTFTLVFRFDDADTDTGATAVDFPARGDRYRDDRRRLTAGLNFRPVERTAIKFEYQWFFEPSGVPEVDNNRLVASMTTYF